MFIPNQNVINPMWDWQRHGKTIPCYSNHHDILFHLSWQTLHYCTVVGKVDRPIFPTEDPVLLSNDWVAVKKNYKDNVLPWCCPASYVQLTGGRFIQLPSLLFYDGSISYANDLASYHIGSFADDKVTLHEIILGIAHGADPTQIGTVPIPLSDYLNVRNLIEQAGFTTSIAGQ